MGTYALRPGEPSLIGRNRADVWTVAQALNWLCEMENVKELSADQVILLRDLCRGGKVLFAGIGKNANCLWPDTKIAAFEKEVVAAAPKGFVIRADEMEEMDFIIERPPRSGAPPDACLNWRDTNIVAYDPIEINRTSLIRAYFANRDRTVAPKTKAARKAAASKSVGRPPTKMPQIVAQMLEKLRAGETLPDGPQKVQAALYDCNRDTWRKARAEAIKIFSKEQASVGNVGN